MIELLSNPEIVSEILNTIIAKENLANPKITFKTGSNIGEGFLGEKTTVEITDGDKSLDLFIKTAPKHERSRMSLQIKPAYSNEYIFYEDIYPRLDAFHVQKLGKSLEIVPKYHAGSLEEGKEVLVLENIKVNGFDLNGAKNIFNEGQITAILRTYAKFHATSFAFKDQNAGAFDEMTKDISEFYSVLFRTARLHLVFNRSCNIIKKRLDPTEDKVMVEKIGNFLDNLDDILTEIKKFKGAYCVVTHGDCNNNNIMFRRKKEENSLELRLIDFQATNVTSPMWDLSYFFYTSASSEENLAKLDSYLEMYYENLSTTIRELGSNPETLYPKHLMEEHWKIFSKFSFIMAVLFLTRICDEVAQSTVDLIDGKVLNKEELLMQKTRPLLRHFIDRGLL